MKYICPKSDQIRIFNALKTEITLKKELENQLQKISKLERELSKVKMSQNQEEIKTIEAALQFTKSYFKNLLVKQETERLLNEQQKILKQDSAHRCQDTKKCDKCSVETQIHEILRKVRESINKDLVEARQRLKVQKMPDINIKQPLQIQHTLRLNIPPTSPPQECVRNNVACETVFADDKNDKSFADREVQTRIFVNKTTSVESQPETKSPKNDKSDSKKKSPGKEGVRILKFLDKSTYCMELTGKKGNSVNDIRIRPKREKCTPEDTYCCKLLKAREAMRESIFEISHKTPSELGFRCTVGTQCDSETSLSEPRITTTVKMTENRSVGVDDSSNYLFGFKEYLRDKSVDCSSVRRSSNKVDVVLQVNLDRSFDSDLDSMAKSTQSEYNKPVWPPTIPKRISVLHDKDEDVSKSTTLTDPALTEETNMYSLSKKRLDSRIKSIPRIPSLKKMFFPPEDREEVPVDAKTVSNNLQNELTEVKLKTKRVSNTQEEALDLEIETGDVFYKSLIGTTDLPERKTIVSLDHLKMNTSSSSRQTLRTLSTEDHDEDGQSLVHPVILEQMTENQTVEDVQSIDGEYIEDENGAISPKESNEKKADENLSIDYDLTINNKEQEQQVDLPIYMSQSEIDNEIVNDMFLPSSQADNEVPDETKFSYSNYLPSEDITGESPAELHYENLDNELVSKENTQMLESIVSKIMDNAKDKITEQYEMVHQEPENKTEEEKILEADFNISDFDYTHFPRNKSEEKQKHDESKEDTVLSLFSPNYTLNINKTNKDHKGNILEADFLPNLPIFLKSNKTFENYKSFHDSLQLSDDTSHIVEKPSKMTEHSKQHETKTLHYINQVTNDPYGRNEESCKIDRFDFPPRHIERKMLDNSNPKNRLEGLKKIAEERLEYAKKCSKEERSFDSSILSSEGEVKCKCPHVSVGEYHHCPYQKRVRLKNPYPSIQYKNKLSSHIVLENERKHYNHWVTYYSNKKEEESSTSNSIGSKGTKD
ncbi:hypothetical protein WA026_015618 [Henosepilachna vigintioctopunctata]|uniref:Uncharacterized protein n=1 Tax=Henosepilachna vigintioctopunctata TaxID=420089 RepID=A0AAW1VH21_9CUCU